MCWNGRDPEMAGLHAGHLPLLLEAAPEVANVTNDLYSALTENLNPHLPVLPAFVAMVEAVNRGDFGLLGEYHLIRLPFSIIGADKLRYRTQMVEWLHDSILPLRMSEITINAIQEVLKSHGLRLLFGCSCSAAMGHLDDVQAYYDSGHQRDMDLFRSAIDAASYPVKLVGSFEEITVPTMDLHVSGAEERLFNRIEELTRLAAVAGHPDYSSWLDDELQRFVDQAQQSASPVLIGV